MEGSIAPTDLGALAALAWTWAADFLPRLGGALLLAIAGLFLASWASRAVAAVIRKAPHLDATLAVPISAAVRYGILIPVAVAVLGQLGVQTASILAALGAAGLAIGLALQGTLSNIAAGFMLLWLRPFRAGDYIEAAGIAGIVREVGLFATQLDTFDGLYRFVPNSELWNKPLLNHSRNPKRMADIKIGIDYGADIAKAKAILLDLAASDERVLGTPPPDVFVDALGDNAVVLALRAWIATPAYWPTQRYLVEEAKRRLEANGISIPFPQRVVKVIGGGGGGLAAPRRPEGDI